MYGLIYDILRANEWLEANRATMCPGFPADVTCKIELYYGYRESKASPNRCTPTDLHVGPAYTGSGTITHSHAKWNDAVTFEVATTTSRGTGKKLVWSTATCEHRPASALDHTSSRPRLSAWLGPRRSAHARSRPRVSSIVRYWGGSFIIDDADALTFRKLLKVGGDAVTAKDVDGNSIDFSPFRQTSCSFGSTVGGGVNVHRAMVEFTAPTPKLFNSTPPRIALLAQNSGGSTALKTGTISDSILQEYLERAGLTYAGAQGCPPGAFTLSLRGSRTAASPGRTTISSTSSM